MMSKFAIMTNRSDKPLDLQGGLGTQLYRTILGYIASYNNDKLGEFRYTLMQNFCFPGDKVSLQSDYNGELIRTNITLKSLMKHLGVQEADEWTRMIPPVPNLCDEKAFNSGALQNLQSAWPLPNPHKKQKTLSIHIRLGDVVDCKEYRSRYQPFEYYNNIIDQCLICFPDYKIQTISWGQPDLDPIIAKHITMNYVDSGYRFLGHFNEMVHSNILIPAHSCFSLAAGLFNKNTIMCDENIMTSGDPYPQAWNDNYKTIS